MKIYNKKEDSEEQPGLYRHVAVHRTPPATPRVHDWEYWAGARWPPNSMNRRCMSYPHRPTLGRKTPSTQNIAVGATACCGLLRKSMISTDVHLVGGAGRVSRKGTH